MRTRRGSFILRSNAVFHTGSLRSPSRCSRRHLRLSKPARIAPLIAILVFAALEPAASASSKRERAAKAYNHALQMRAAFNSRHSGSHSFRDYARLVKAFDAVYRLDPAYSNTPKALLAEAQINEQMAHVFASARYYDSAAETYRFLVDQYPLASVSRDALFALAEIDRVDLNNPQEAGKAYTEFLTKYPYTAKATEARLRLKEINRRLDASAARQARTAEESASKPASSVVSPAQPVTISDVRYWEGPNYTRVVISLDDEAKFQVVRLSHPDRIVFDLPGTHLGTSLGGKAFPVGNGFLQQIRVSQYKPDISRVVLDLEKIHDYSVFTLPNPFRMIIDIHGQPPLLESRLGGASSSTGAARVAAAAVPAQTRDLPSGSPPSPSPVEPADRETINPEDNNERRTETATDESLPTAADAGDSGSDSTGANIASAAGSSAGTAPLQPSPSAHTSGGSSTLTRALGLKIARIVIDPGHGGHDTGTLGPDGIAEKDVVLDVALRLRRLIQQRMGSEVVMTRADDTFIPLEERTAIANQRQADLFISIHANASHDPSARGVEVYYLNFTSDPNSLEVAARENATSQESVHQLQSLIKKIALTEKIEESNDFARQVDQGLEQATARNGNPNRGLKKAPFVVLIGANMPSILAEISFLTNPHDEHLLQQAQYRQQIAEGLYRGVTRYVSTLGSMQIAQRGGRLPTRRVSSRSPMRAPSPGARSSAGPQDF